MMVVVLQVDALRLRLEEKESFLNKKTKQLQDLTEEKGTLAGEIRDMKDMLEVKERKINVLQKKVRKRDKCWNKCPSHSQTVSYIISGLKPTVARRWRPMCSRCTELTDEGSKLFFQSLVSGSKPVTL